jgi:Arf-GAP/coiled-coil/ANK repeat/PH domain-containing protein
LADELLQMTALSNIEAKKKFEFLEAVSGSMDAHLRYFKQASFPEGI